MKRFCFALDLIDNQELIREYERHHAPGNAWPEVTQHDRDVGIVNLQIFRTGNRMFMIMETDDTFTLEKKAALDASNHKVQEWEELMSKYQSPLPWSRREKWVLMKQIFQS